MRFSKRLLLTVLGILAVSLLSAFLARRGDDVGLWLPLGVAIGSLAVAVLAAFKNELFEFAPAVVGTQVVLMHASPSMEQFTVAFPFHFINTGYAEGVIEWVAVKITRSSDGQSSTLVPLLEIDLAHFLKQKPQLHVDNILGIFASFPLGSKAVITKAILFAIPPNKPAFALMEGEHRFDIFVKDAVRARPTKIHHFTYTFSGENLRDYLAGKSVYLGDQHINL